MIVSIFVFLLECMKLFLAVCGCLNYKLKRRPVASIVLLLLSLMFVGILAAWKGEYYATMVSVVVIPIVVLSVEGKNKGVFSVLSFWGICYLDDFVLLVLRKLIFASVSLPNNSRTFWGVGVISLSILAITAFFLQRFVYTKYARLNYFFQNIPRGYVGMLLVGVFMSSMLTVPYTSTDFEWSREDARELALMSAIFCMVFLAVGGLMIYNHSSKRHYMSTAKLNQERMELKENYYRNLLEKEQETRRFRHDMSAHMTCLKGMLDENRIEEAQDYLKELSGGMDKLKQRVQTGNLLVNAILSDLAERYKGVRIEWDGMLPDLLRLSDMDVCVIFSNLLENAFLAAAGCEDSGKVQVKADIIAGALRVVVQNDMAKPIEKRHERFITQKPDKKNHGFGIMNVKECVSVNGGEILFDYTETNFTVSLTLPNII